jgi:hypothetical protein
MFAKKFLTITFSLCLLAACDERRSKSALPHQSQAETPAPVRIGVLFDLSASAPANRTPIPTLEQMQSLFKVLKECGGELALFPVRAIADGGLLRVRIEPPVPAPPTPPEAAMAGKTVFEKRKIWEAYSLERAQWNAKEEQRQAQADADVQKFEAAIRPLLTAPRTETRSDVFHSFQLLDRFFSEPGIEQSRSLMLCLTDAIDTQSKQVYQFRSQPVTVVAARHEISLPGLKPKHFEGLEAALRWIVEWAAHPAPEVATVHPPERGN